MSEVELPTLDQAKSSMADVTTVDQHAASEEVTSTAHRLPVPSLLKLLRAEDAVNVDAPLKSVGLTTKEAEKRLQADGPNELTPPSELPWLLKYLKHFREPLHVLLLVSGIFSCIVYGLDTSQPINLWLGIVLYVVTILSATVSFIQEGRSSSVMKVLPHPHCSVVTHRGANAAAVGLFAFPLNYAINHRVELPEPHPPHDPSVSERIGNHHSGE